MLIPEPTTSKQTRTATTPGVIALGSWTERPTGGATPGYAQPLISEADLAHHWCRALGSVPRVNDCQDLRGGLRVVLVRPGTASRPIQAALVHELCDSGEGPRADRCVLRGRDRLRHDERADLLPLDTSLDVGNGAPRALTFHSSLS